MANTNTKPGILKKLVGAAKNAWNAPGEYASLAKSAYDANQNQQTIDQGFQSQAKKNARTAFDKDSFMKEKYGTNVPAIGSKAASDTPGLRSDFNSKFYGPAQDAMRTKKPGLSYPKKNDEFSQ